MGDNSQEPGHICKSNFTLVMSFWPTGAAASILVTWFFCPWVLGKTSETITTLLQAQILQGTPGVGCATKKEECQVPVPCTVGGLCMVQLCLGAASSFPAEQMGAAGERRGAL